MSDDIVARLRDDYQKTVPLCAEAADEIERLRAELAAADEGKRQALVDANELLLDVKNEEAKVDGYRAALKAVEAKLSDAQEKLDAYDMDGAAAAMAVKAAEAERDTLRALLREAREYVAVVGDSMEADYAIDVRVRIDAALKGRED